MPSPFRPALALVALLLATQAPFAAEREGDGEQARRPPPAVLLPAYRQECGACHLAYAPALLPAPAWQQLMDTLPKHFGTDASLDDATRRTLSTWLAARAAQRGRSDAVPAQNRITRAAWFVREHREVPASTWTSPAVKSASRCDACHLHAEQGNFDEHDIRIPR